MVKSGSQMRSKLSKNLLVIIALLVFVVPLHSKTRWSSLHIVPDADMYSSGEFTAGFDAYLWDSSDSYIMKPSIPLKFGITEWINLEVAYSGGMSVGIKGRLLGETSKLMPSLAVGVYNLFNNKEANYFSIDSSQEYTAEVYIALGKTITKIRTRINLGFQSLPKSEKDKYNPFMSIEKYFGYGLYASLEFYRRYEEFHLSLFANWRIFKKHLEISAGVVDLKNILFDESGKFSVSMAPVDPNAYVKPGIWIGLKYHGKFGIGKNKGFMTVEDRLKKQDEEITRLVGIVDTLKKENSNIQSNIKGFKGSVNSFIDSVNNDPTKISNIIYSKLVELRSLYESEPFDPELVKRKTRELVSYKNKAVPSLIKFLSDKTVDRHIRLYSAQIIGDIALPSSSDAVLDILASTSDPDIQIELLIALGKMKETRAMFILEQLSNSENDNVAMAAQEVLFKLSKETGVEPNKKNFRKIIEKPIEPPKKIIKKDTTKLVSKTTDTTEVKDSVTIKPQSTDSSANSNDTITPTKTDSAVADSSVQKETNKTDSKSSNSIDKKESSDSKKMDDTKKSDSKKRKKKDKKKSKKESKKDKKKSSEEKKAERKKRREEDAKGGW